MCDSSTILKITYFYERNMGVKKADQTQCLTFEKKKKMEKIFRGSTKYWIKKKVQ